MDISEKLTSKSRSRFSLTFNVFGLTDTGILRDENQDAFILDPDNGLFVLSDGMGGAQGGALASQTIVEVLPRLINDRLRHIPRRTPKSVVPLLGMVIKDFSAMLRDKAKLDSDLVGMGATLLLAQYVWSTLYIAHLGDSRAYLYRNGKLKQLTRDHAEVAILLELGQITQEESENHPMQGMLSSCVGMDGHAIADIQTFKPMPTDRLLLCSDGLTNMVTDKEIEVILSQTNKPDEACKSLVENANKAGGADNITVVIIDFKEKIRET